MKTWPALTFRAPSDRPCLIDGLPLDDALQVALLDDAVTAMSELAPGVWQVFFTDAAARDRAGVGLPTGFSEAGVLVSAADVEDEDWAARSQASLKAVRVGGITVAPPWDIPHDDTLTLVIQPSMGFGTGHHATTRLCLAALQRLDLRGADVLDVGTGSGVLAIAAARLGASHVLAIDDDPDAMESARENVALNPGADVTLGTVDLRQTQLRPVDLVLANLTGGLLVSAAATLLAMSRNRLILSGFLLTEAPEVRAAFAERTIEHEGQEDEWGCLTLAARPS